MGTLRVSRSTRLLSIYNASQRATTYDAATFFATPETSPEDLYSMHGRTKRALGKKWSTYSPCGALPILQRPAAIKRPMGPAE